MDAALLACASPPRWGKMQRMPAHESPAAEAARRVAHCLHKGRDHLNLAGLDLTELPQDFVKLTGLRYLELKGNQLTKLPDEICTFTDLRWLGLNFNFLISLPDQIGNLKKLERLYLRENRMKQLPDSLGELESLLELDLRSNRFSKLPHSFRQLLLREDPPLFFDLADNDSQISVVASTGETPQERHAALLQYLTDLEKKSVTLRQGKLLLVGEGSMGKSTLLDALLDQPFIEQRKTTHGLEVRPVTFRKREDGWDGVLHCWDFSGQEAMRETHQIFFTTPAIYLLVWNHRIGEDHAKLEEWLTLIDQRTRGTAKVLIVAKEAAGRDAELKCADELQRQFGGTGGLLLDDPFLKVDCKPPYRDGQIAALRQRLAAFSDSADSGFNQDVPANWQTLQQELLALRDEKPFMPWADFEKSCAKLGDVRRFAAALNRMGTWVWIDNERLRDWVILNPDWLSKAVGFVVENDKQRSQRLSVRVAEGGPSGIVSQSQMDLIWNNPPVEDKETKLVFPEPLFPVFRAIMEQFDLTQRLRLPGSSGDVWHLVPNRLAERKPDAWESAWPKKVPAMHWRMELLNSKGTQPLNHWLVSFIFYRLMVRLHAESLGRENFLHSAHWRRGFMLAPLHQGFARVELRGNGFEIQTASHQPRDLWGMVQGALRVLLDELIREQGFEDIKVIEQVSCPSDCPRLGAQRYYLEHHRLAVRAQSGKLGWQDVLFACDRCDREMTAGELWDNRPGEIRAAKQSESLDEVRDQIADLAEMTRDVQGKVTDMHRQFPTLAMQMSDSWHRLLRMEAIQWDDAGHLEQLRISVEHLPRREELERLRGDIAGGVTRYLAALHAPERELPSLFSLIPDDGLAFPGKRWKLYLHCERTLLPVTWLEGTEGQGEFTLQEVPGWLTTSVSYLKGICLALTVFNPVAGLFGALLPAEKIKKAAEAAGKLEKCLDKLPVGAKGHTAHASDARQTPHEASGAALLWLHNFLKQENRTAKLGLVKDRDKGTGTCCWVHPSQQFSVSGS